MQPRKVASDATGRGVATNLRARCSRGDIRGFLLSPLAASRDSGRQSARRRETAGAKFPRPLVREAASGGSQPRERRNVVNLFTDPPRKRCKTLHYVASPDEHRGAEYERGADALRWCRAYHASALFLRASATPRLPSVFPERVRVSCMGKFSRTANAWPGGWLRNLRFSIFRKSSCAFDAPIAQCATYGPQIIPARCRRLAPSPGTPGEGRGEGDFERRETSAGRNHPHPNLLPEYRAKGPEGRLTADRTASFEYPGTRSSSVGPGGVVRRADPTSTRSSGRCRWLRRSGSR
jgi:hypothetical protein